MEEGREAPGLRGLGLLVVRHRLGGEEDAQQRAGVLDAVRHPFGGECIAEQTPEGLGVAVQCGVDLGVGGTQAREAGGDGDGITGQGAGLVDRSARGEMGHDVGATTEGRGGQTTAHDLAEGHQVSGDPVDAVPAGRARAEAGHHLVHDQQRAVLTGEVAQALVEAGHRGDGAHVAGGGLGDDRSDLAGVRLEGGTHGGEVVVGDDDGVARLGAVTPGEVGRPKVATPEPASASSAST